MSTLEPPMTTDHDHATKIEDAAEHNEQLAHRIHRRALRGLEAGFKLAESARVMRLTLNEAREAQRLEDADETARDEAVSGCRDRVG